MDRTPRPYNIRDRARPSSQELPNAEEYGCNYCPMAFPTKHALSGHQNAHNLRRAVEKTVLERFNSHFGYYGGSLAYPGLYPAPHNRPQGLVGRMQMGYDARPRMPLPGNPYGINISSQSTGQCGHFAQRHGMNPWVSRNGQGGSGSGSCSGPVYPDLSIFAAPRSQPDEGEGEEQDEVDSGLDLSFKL